MAETYRGHVLAEAHVDQIAVYDRGTFKGHCGSIEDARAFVDRAILQREWEQQP